MMRRKKLPRSSASAASANARAAAVAIVNGKDKHQRERWEQQRLQKRQPWQRIRTLLAVLFTFLAVKWIFNGYPNRNFPLSSNFRTPDVSNLSINNVTGMLQESFSDFYDANVQPLMDHGLFAFNGTNHDVGEKSRVGYQLREKNARAKHPVVLIPGFVTSGLELWEGTACAKKHFRQRLWGSTSMARTFFADRECWRRHLALNPQTGMDPDGIRLRPAQGFEAADNFIATYWVWSKLIENLADVGYDGSTMTMMSYDWRLGYEYLEKRDGYFTKLKKTIEAHCTTTGEKAVVVSHSMGGTVAYYFFQWVVADVKVGGGGGGKKWIEKHVKAFVNIAGTLLGTPKSIPALLSGELKDTAVMLSQLGELLEQYFGRRWRKNLWMTWGSLYGMLPKGGDAIWGNADLANDNDSGESGTEIEHTNEASDGTRVRLRSSPTIIWNNGTGDMCLSSSSDSESRPPIEVPVNEEGFNLAGFKTPYRREGEPKMAWARQWSMKETVDYLFENSPKSTSIFSPDATEGWKKYASSKDKRKHWSDPIATSLPHAPSLKIYCLYGTGIPTERSYYYKLSCDKLEGASITDRNDTNLDDMQSSTCEGIANEDEEPPEAPFLLDTSLEDKSRNIQNGVRFSDGDGSVPLISLGYMCEKWSQCQRPLFFRKFRQSCKNPHNPSGINVYIRERKHEAQVSLSDPGRGGPSSGEHVDILGNVKVVEDVVRIATGFEMEKVNENIIVSELKEIARRIEEHELKDG